MGLTTSHRKIWLLAILAGLALILVLWPLLALIPSSEAWRLWMALLAGLTLSLIGFIRFLAGFPSLSLRKTGRAWPFHRPGKSSGQNQVGAPELAAYRKEFLGNVSHELKTPLFTLQGTVSTLLDGGLEDPSINRAFLEKAERAINRLTEIVQDLEKISLLESSELQLHKSRFDMADLAREVFEMEELRAADRGISLTLDPAPRGPVWVFADRRRIMEALENLVSNSIKYGREGGHTRLYFLDQGTLIQTVVEDDGNGIEPRYHERIFERFFRVDRSRSREAGGSGLGLAIVKHILEAHGQTISVQSQPGTGSLFSFTLAKT